MLHRHRQRGWKGRGKHCHSETLLHTHEVGHDQKFWWRLKKLEILGYCLWERKMGQLLWKTMWQFVKKLNTELLPTTPLLGMCPKELRDSNPRTRKLISVLPTTAKAWTRLKRPSADERTGNCGLWSTIPFVYPCKGTEQWHLPQLCWAAGTPHWAQGARCRRPHVGRFCLYDISRMRKSAETENGPMVAGGWEGRGGRNDCLKGPRSPFGVTKMFGTRESWWSQTLGTY